jgi:arylsulfatase A-like enzyme
MILPIRLFLLGAVAAALMLATIRAGFPAANAAPFSGIAIQTASPTPPPWFKPIPASTPVLAQPRIVILMVWDGLRPDSVNPHDTPALAALIKHGVRFAHHHSVYPSITLVNAAALATGTGPGGDGIFGDSMYLAPSLDPHGTLAAGPLKSLIARPFNMEDSHKLAMLNGAEGYKGEVNSFPSLAHQVIASGGYVALIGKQGPTYLFDSADLATAPPSKNLLFVADDMALPDSMTATLAAAPRISRDDASSIAARDAWFTKLVIDDALPVAKKANAAGKPALIVLWQHNPDLSQHMFGLGTRQALDALSACDRNLGAVRAALKARHLEQRTDVIIVSDHGFATIKAMVPLADLLVAVHLKESPTSDDIVVARNGGTDLIYLSREKYGSSKVRRAILTRIVDFVANQDWSGPIFSRDPDPSVNYGNYHGSIPGTFSASYFGLANAERAPDLIVSFRELPDQSNFGVTGPMNSAYVTAPGPAIGAESISKPMPDSSNHSAELVRPVDGLMYADAGAAFTTGMGMHGAAGERELHNFGAALGPDFKPGFVDTLPTGNSDIAPTIGALLQTRQPAGLSGRFLYESLSQEGYANARYLLPPPTGPLPMHRVIQPRPYPLTQTTTFLTDHETIVTTIHATRFGDQLYLDSSDVTRTMR